MGVQMNLLYQKRSRWLVACERFGLATTGLHVVFNCASTLYFALVRRAREEAALVWTCFEFAAMFAGGDGDG